MIHCQSTVAITAFLPSRGHPLPPRPKKKEKEKKGEVGETPQHRGCRRRFNPHQNYRRDSVCAFRTRERRESFACWLEEMPCFVFQWMIKLNLCPPPFASAHCVVQKCSDARVVDEPIQAHSFILLQWTSPMFSVSKEILLLVFIFSNEFYSCSALSGRSISFQGSAKESSIPSRMANVPPKETKGCKILTDKCSSLCEITVALLHVEHGPRHHNRVANYLLEHHYNKFLRCCKANVQLSVFFADLLQNDILRAVKSGQVSLHVAHKPQSPRFSARCERFTSSVLRLPCFLGSRAELKCGKTLVSTSGRSQIPPSGPLDAQLPQLLQRRHCKFITRTLKFLPFP